jgi:ubiquinone/menaquinone biosynthesis C-methylase UbiE
MPEATASTARLAKFYGELSSLDAIMASLSAAGVDADRLTASDLYTRDLDCHNLGMHAMLNLLAAVAGEYGQPSGDDTLLDLGCGLGGPGRFLVDQYGCSVLGVDVLPLRIDIAQILTDKTGMTDRISYHVGDATALDLESRSFAQVWMLDVSMHIRDKRSLFSEIARVLEPGGLLIMHEQTAPIPKAMHPVTRRAPYIAPSLPQLIRYVEEPGLRVLTWRDTTEPVLDYFRGVRAMFPTPPASVSNLRAPHEHDFGLAMLDGYIETLAHLGGRTGILVARRIAPRTPLVANPRVRVPSLKS